MRIHRPTKIIFVIFLLFLALGIVSGTWYYYKNLRGVRPAVNPVSGDVTTLVPASGVSGNSTGMPLNLPEDFSISVFDKNIPGARVMAFDREGNMWVSQTRRGEISKLTIQDGKIVKQEVVLDHLTTPHGLAFDGNTLYFAEENKISRFDTGNKNPAQKIADLPGGGEHITRTLGFGPDDRLYVSIGSSCNACNEQDERRASIYSLNKDGSDFKRVASGLRNSVFFTWDNAGKMWATDMGRDYLGDNLPADEVNVIESGKNYGWPICYEQNTHDTDFDKNQYIQDPCKNKVPPKVQVPAHSAPLGLAFVPSSWPKEFQGSLLVAFHGSSMSQKPNGYKIAQIKFDAQGGYKEMADFISGWLPEGAAGKQAPGKSYGRPVGLVFDPQGNLYVSDDKAGVIYKVSYSAKQSAQNNSAIKLTNLKENQTVKSPLVVEGEAPGNWFFEASFPVRLLDSSGKVIVAAPAQAQGEWMVDGPVKFKATLNFTAPYTEDGTLVLENDNPSGMPGNSKKVTLPIKFDLSSAVVPSGTACGPGIACDVIPANSN